VYTLDISPDGKYLVAGGAAEGDGTKNYIELYELSNMSAPPKKIYGFVESVEHIEFTNDSKGVYVRDNAGRSIKYSDLSSTKEVINAKVKINAIALSHDGNILAGAGDDGTLYLWDVRNNFAEKELFKNPRQGELDPASLTALAFAPNDKQNRIVIGDENGLVRIVTSATSSRALSGHTAHVEQIKFNNAGTAVATISRDRSARLWDWTDIGKQPVVMNDHDDWAWAAAFSPDDQQLMVGVNSNTRVAKETIHAYPTKLSTMSSLLCGYVTRNLTKDE